MSNNNAYELARRWYSPRGEWAVTWTHGGESRIVGRLNRVNAYRLANLLVRHGVQWGHEDVCVLASRTGVVHPISPATPRVHAAATVPGGTLVGWTVTVLVQVLVVLGLAIR